MTCLTDLSHSEMTASNELKPLEVYPQLCGTNSASAWCDACIQCSSISSSRIANGNSAVRVRSGSMYWYWKPHHQLNSAKTRAPIFPTTALSMQQPWLVRRNNGHWWPLVVMLHCCCCYQNDDGSNQTTTTIPLYNDGESPACKQD